MNILFVSFLKDNLSAGPSWSVPASVRAQNDFDNVLWINGYKKALPHWMDTGVFKAFKNPRKVRLKNMPVPFNNPDVVIFNCIYDNINEIFFAYELRKKGIPYIVIPRGSLTASAMNNSSRFKKKIAHFLFYDSFLKHALKIQYLTSKEYEDSLKMFDLPCFVLPNGINKPLCTKKEFSKKIINAVYIGRIDIYHKGLDLLIDACASLHDKLHNSFRLDIYGPQNDDSLKMKQLISKSHLDDIIYVHKGVTGKQKQTILLNSDVFILTSRFEGHPMALIEALSYGLPCLITRGTNMLEEVQDANAGWVCEISCNSIKDGIIQMLNDVDRLQNKSNNAITLSSKYDWKLIAKSLHKQLFESIINK